jgi:hypothetical protein
MSDCGATMMQLPSQELISSQFQWLSNCLRIRRRQAEKPFRRQNYRTTRCSSQAFAAWYPSLLTARTRRIRQKRTSRLQAWPPAAARACSILTIFRVLLIAIFGPPLLGGCGFVDGFGYIPSRVHSGIAMVCVIESLDCRPHHSVVFIRSRPARFHSCGHGSTSVASFLTNQSFRKTKMSLHQSKHPLDDENLDAGDESQPPQEKNEASNRSRSCK